MTNTFFDTGEALAWLRARTTYFIPANTFRGWIYREKLKTERVGGKILIKQSELERFLREETTTNDQE